MNHYLKYDPWSKNKSESIERPSVGVFSNKVDQQWTMQRFQFLELLSFYGPQPLGTHLIHLANTFKYIRSSPKKTLSSNQHQKLPSVYKTAFYPPVNAIKIFPTKVKTLIHIPKIYRNNHLWLDNFTMMNLTEINLDQQFRCLSFAKNMCLPTPDNLRFENSHELDDFVWQIELR